MAADSEAGRARDDSGDAASEVETRREQAIRTIALRAAYSFPAGGALFMVLFVFSDWPASGAAALLLVFAFGFPPATYALALAPALAAWPPDRARRVAWLAALASLPIALVGAVTALLLVATVDYVL